MADSSVSVAGPVSVQSDAKERVAFDLMVRIASHEKDVERDRNYWLSLYRQCYLATSGSRLEVILSKSV